MWQRNPTFHACGILSDPVSWRWYPHQPRVLLSQRLNSILQLLYVRYFGRGLRYLGHQAADLI